MLNFYIYSTKIFNYKDNEILCNVKYFDLDKDNIIQVSNIIQIFNDLHNSETYILYIDITHDEDLYLIIKDIDFSKLIFDVIYFYSNKYLLHYDNCINLITYKIQYLESTPPFYHVVYKTKHLINSNTYNIMYINHTYFNIINYYKNIKCINGILLQTSGTCAYNSTFNGLFMTYKIRHLILYKFKATIRKHPELIDEIISSYKSDTCFEISKLTDVKIFSLFYYAFNKTYTSTNDYIPNIFSPSHYDIDHLGRIKSVYSEKYTLSKNIIKLLYKILKILKIRYFTIDNDMSKISEIPQLFISDLLIMSEPNFPIIKEETTKNIKLEYSLILLKNIFGQGHGHAVVGIKCNDKYMICDSNINNIIDIDWTFDIVKINRFYSANNLIYDHIAYAVYALEE
jgi:hypothetical protein